MVTESVKILCENSINNVVIAEGPQIDDDALAPWVEAGHYSRIAKLADHYAVETTLICPQASLDDAQVREFDPLTYVIAQPEKTISAAFAHAVKGVAVTGFGSGSAMVPDGLDALQGGTYFLTTPWDLLGECDFADVQHDIAAIESFLKRQ